MEVPPSSDDLLVAGLVVLVALISFIAVLYLNRENSGNKKKSVKQEEEEAGGTVLVEEGGRTVRRSTRQPKPVIASEEVGKSPAATRVSTVLLCGRAALSAHAGHGLLLSSLVNRRGRQQPATSR
jgi:hypothetical protein